MRYNVIYSDYWIPRSHLRDVALGDHLVKSAEIVYPQRHLRGPLGGPNCLNRCYIAHITCKWRENYIKSSPGSFGVPALVLWYGPESTILRWKSTCSKGALKTSKRVEQLLGMNSRWIHTTREVVFHNKIWNRVFGRKVTPKMTPLGVPKIGPWGTPNDQMTSESGQNALKAPGNHQEHVRMVFKLHWGCKRARKILNLAWWAGDKGTWRPIYPFWGISRGVQKEVWSWPHTYAQRCSYTCWRWEYVYQVEGTPGSHVVVYADWGRGVFSVKTPQNTEFRLWNYQKFFKFLSSQRREVPTPGADPNETFPIKFGFQEEKSTIGRHA